MGAIVGIGTGNMCDHIQRIKNSLWELDLTGYGENSGNSDASC